MARHKTVEELRRAVAEAAADWVESNLAQYSELAKDTDCDWGSPIEERLFLGLAAAAQEKRFSVELFPYRTGDIAWSVAGATTSPKCSIDGIPPCNVGYTEFDYGRINYQSSAKILRVYQQVGIGKYRADLFVEFTTEGFQKGTSSEPIRRAVVECDGHDFHERTKEQARHDRRRDRYIQGVGLPVLRFTGSEIHADAIGCGHQIIKFFVDASERDYEERWRGTQK